MTPEAQSFLVEQQNPEKGGEVAIVEAAENGDIDMVRYLVEEMGASMHEGRPLQIAAYYGQLEIVQYFHHIDPELVKKRNFHGNTALNRAASNGQLIVVSFLVDHAKSDIDNQANNGLTPVMQAVENGHLETADFLIQRGANLRKLDSSLGDSVGHLAAYFGHLELLTKIIHIEPFLGTLKNNRNMTMLHYAVEGGHNKVVDFLLSFLPSDDQDIFGCSAVIDAVKYGRGQILNILLNHGADVSLQDGNGFTCLHWAAKQGDDDLVQVLAAKDPRLLVTVEKRGLNALQIAEESQQNSTITTLQSIIELKRLEL